MDTTATSASRPATDVPLSRQEKEKLLKQMYTLSHWIDLIRLFGYQTLPMAQAREAIKPLAEKYGNEPCAAACETLIEISTQGSDAFARLKPHIRRMAFQILGPEPASNGSAERATVPPPPPLREETATDTPRPRRQRKPKQPDTVSALSPPQAKPSTADSHSSLMEQYRAAKERHPNMLLVFRIGDFYELFGEDAETAHTLLGLTLTTRDRTLTMAGFPHHQLEVYLHKLLKEGQRVAICEPVEESLARGPIRREVTRVVTPGAMNDEADGEQSEEAEKDVEARPVRQPRHFVLKEFEKWMNAEGLAFVAVDDVRRTTPAVASFVGALDFIVMRGEEKLLVTVRPRLQAKHFKAIRELQNLFGAEYRPVRIWPTEGPDGWNWAEHPVVVPDADPA